jgi:hypothetical protein
MIIFIKFQSSQRLEQVKKNGWAHVIARTVGGLVSNNSPDPNGVYMIEGAKYPMTAQNYPKAVLDHKPVVSIMVKHALNVTLDGASNSFKRVM